MIEKKSDYIVNAEPIEDESTWTSRHSTNRKAIFHAGSHVYCASELIV